MCVHMCVVKLFLPLADAHCLPRSSDVTSPGSPLCPYRSGVAALPGDLLVPCIHLLKSDHAVL